VNTIDGTEFDSYYVEDWYGPLPGPKKSASHIYNYVKTPGSNSTNLSHIYDHDLRKSTYAAGDTTPLDLRTGA
jgi:hypothetical protein